MVTNLLGWLRCVWSMGKVVGVVTKYCHRSKQTLDSRGFTCTRLAAFTTTFVLFDHQTFNSSHF